MHKLTQRNPNTYNKLSSRAFFYVNKLLIPLESGAYCSLQNSALQTVVLNIAWASILRLSCKLSSSNFFYVICNDNICGVYCSLLQSRVEATSCGGKLSGVVDKMASYYGNFSIHFLPVTMATIPFISFLHNNHHQS